MPATPTSSASRSTAPPAADSGVAARKDAELVALRVSEDDPAHIVALADVSVSSTEVEQSADLFVLLAVGRVDVQVEPVLDGLALGHARERQRRWHRANAFLAFRNQRGANGDNFVVLVLHLVVKDRAPEPGETVRIGTVDLQLGELTGHVRISRSRSAKAQTLTAQPATEKLDSYHRRQFASAGTGRRLRRLPSRRSQGETGEQRLRGGHHGRRV
jgi:hypothetical protein